MCEVVCKLSLRDRVNSNWCVTGSLVDLENLVATKNYN